MGYFSVQIALSLALFVGVALSGVYVVKPDEYLLEWEISAGNLTVTATVKSLGFVGFGLSPYGSMMEADVIFAGRYANGTGYVQDSYAFADAGPLRDTIQNVVLISSVENSTHTTVTWTRKLDTGDVEQDRPVLNETSYIIWSWGPTDSFFYHGPNRGTVSLNLVADN